MPIDLAKPEGTRTVYIQPFSENARQIEREVYVYRCPKCGYEMPVMVGSSVFGFPVPSRNKVRCLGCERPKLKARKSPTMPKKPASNKSEHDKIVEEINARAAKREAKKAATKKVATKKQPTRNKLKENGTPPIAKKPARKKAASGTCVACGGSGKSTSGDTCHPCRGTGKTGMAPFKPTEEQLQESIERRVARLNGTYNGKRLYLDEKGEPTPVPPQPATTVTTSTMPVTVVEQPAKLKARSEPKHVTVKGETLTVVQRHVLQALVDAAGAALTYKEIDAVVTKSYGKSVYAGLTAVLRTKHNTSLGAKGLVQESVVDGKLKFSATKKGMELL